MSSASPASLRATSQSPAPPKPATVSLNGHAVTITYGAPSLRGRKLGAELVPWDKVWRTGANDATSLTTDIALKIGGTVVPAGSYTIYTLPNPSRWLFIINKQTKQWGTEYHQEQTSPASRCRARSSHPAGEDVYLV